MRAISERSRAVPCTVAFVCWIETHLIPPCLRLVVLDERAVGTVAPLNWMIHFSPFPIIY